VFAVWSRCREIANLRDKHTPTGAISHEFVLFQRANAKKSTKKRRF
jgi:hypothetical protein